MRWVGSVVQAPQGSRCRSSGGREKHYGAVELSEAGQQVYLNDVVEVLPPKQEQRQQMQQQQQQPSGQTRKRGQPRLAQMGSAVPSRVSLLLILLTQTESGAYSRDHLDPLVCRDGVHLYRQPPSGKSRFNQVTQLSTDGVYYQESAGTEPIVLKIMSMWEDAFTGVFKFRGRWLVHSTEVREEALSSLRSARRAFATREPEAVGGARGHCRAEEELEHPGEEVFLTHEEDNVEVGRVIKHVTLSVPTSKMTEIPPEWKGKTGPRLTHAFDGSTGEFFALENSDPVLRRARARQSELVATLLSHTLEDHKTASSGSRGVRYTGRGSRAGRGWLLPKANAFESTSTDNKHGQGVSKISEASKAHDHSLPKKFMADATSSEIDRSDDGKDDRNRNIASSREDGVVNAKRARNITHQLCQRENTDGGGDGRGGVDAVEEMATVEAFALPPKNTGVSSAINSGALMPRSRRLAMPPARPARPDAELEPGNKPGTPTTCLQRLFPLATSRHTRGSLMEGLAQSPSSMKLRSSSAENSSDSAQCPSMTASVKKRVGALRVASREVEAEGPDCPSRVTPVGDAFQAEIPTILSTEERAASETRTGAELVWRSVRDWDDRSRTFLADYLGRARETVRECQAQIGVPVHVRLAGGTNGNSDRDSGNTLDRRVAGSYAVWAITTNREKYQDKDKIVRVACSEMAQTEVPRSGVQIVQFEEEALTALFKTANGNVPGAHDPDSALEMFADSRASPQTLEPWTLTQVRTLEKVLEQEFDSARRPHDWSPETDVDEDDFIDLASVSKQIPGKSPSQVLAFYYRYIAVAEPLTDVVYGPEAAEARKKEPLYQASLGGDGSGGTSVRAAAEAAESKEASAMERERGSIRLYAPVSVQSVEAKRRHSDWGMPRGSNPMAEEIKLTPQYETPLQRSAFDVAAGGSMYASMRQGPVSSPRGLAARNSEGMRYPGPPFDQGGVDKDQRQQREFAPRESTPPKTIPPDVEVLEIGDSDEDNRAARGGYHANDAKGVPEFPGPRSDANIHYSSAPPTGPDGRHTAESHRPPMSPRSTWVAGQMRWSPGLTRAAGGQVPFRTPHGQLHLVPMSSSRGYPIGASSHDSFAPPGGLRQDHPQFHSPRYPQAPSGYFTPFAPGYRGSGSGSGSGFDQDTSRRRSITSEDHVVPAGNRLGGTVEGNHSWTAEQEFNDHEFGVMAPCWRLLERAKAFMDRDQFEYMRGLILANVKKSMSRDQMLIRIESCLEGKDAIIIPFMKMFDRIEQNTLVPLYTGKKGIEMGTEKSITVTAVSYTPETSDTRPFTGSSVPQPSRSGPDPYGASGYPSYSARAGASEMLCSRRGHSSGSFGANSANAMLLHHVVSPAYAPADVRLRSAPPYGRSGRGELGHFHHLSSAPPLTEAQSQSAQLDAEMFPDRFRHLSQQPPPQWRVGENASMMDASRNGWGQR